MCDFFKFRACELFLLIPRAHNFLTKRDYNIAKERVARPSIYELVGLVVYNALIRTVDCNLI